MNFKLPIISGILILAFVAFAAALSVTPSTLSFSLNDLSNPFTVSSSTASNFSLLSSTAVISNVQFTISPSTSTTNTQSATYSVTASPVSGSLSNLAFGTYSTTATINAVNSANAADSSNSTITLQFVKGFCSAGNVGNSTTGMLEIRDIDIDSTGDDDDVWQPLDEITIDVEVKNPSDEDVDDVVVELGLYDSAGNNFADDLDFSSSDEEEADLGNLNDDSSETVTFEFKVPADFDDGDYTLVVKAYSDGDENIVCADNGAGDSVDVEREDDDGMTIAVDDIQIPTEAVCGESISGSFDLVNVGDNDEDQVKVELTSSELGLFQEIEVKNLDESDSKRVDFNMDIPSSGISDGTYLIKFKTYYDYDDGDYDEESDQTFATSIKLLGCGSSSESTSLSIDASLQDDEAIAGGKAIVMATLTNLGSSTSSYTVTATGYESWASLVGVSPETVTLAPGASKTVKITLDISGDASGSESFNIQAISQSDKLETQEVELNIRAGMSSLSLGGNTTLWIVGLVNVILIILIIFIAVRLGRR